MKNHVLTAALLPLLLVSVSAARPTYVGYSGAPGSSGTCASSCHGSSGGTIIVTGFPAEYSPGQSYVISVTHNGGSLISNFNASVRIDSGSHTAGVITAGYQTTTYSTSTEPNGVHLSASGLDSCTFTWTAPDTGASEVKLYLAGMQGTSRSGQNSTLVLTASLMTGAVERPAPAVRRSRLDVYPTPATGRVVLQLSLPAGARPTLYVTDRQGRVVSRIPVAGTDHTSQTIIWKPLADDGGRLAAGTYFITLRCGPDRVVRKLVTR